MQRIDRSRVPVNVPHRSYGNRAMRLFNYLFSGVSSIFLITGCISEKTLVKDHYIQGTYVSDGHLSRELIFEGSSFWFVESEAQHMPLYTCCDTLAFGTWKPDEGTNFLFLNSSEYYESPFLKANVLESNSANIDSIYFVIENPIERFYRGHKYVPINRDILYRIDITSNNRDFDLGIYAQYYKKNHITIVKPEGLKVHSLSIEIVPNYNFGGKNIGIRQVFTYPYQVENEKASKFFISIDKLDYQFMSYQRIDNDYVKIIGSDKLFWKGLYFLKTSN